MGSTWECTTNYIVMCEDRQFEYCISRFIVGKFSFVLVGIYRSLNSDSCVFFDRLNATIFKLTKKHGKVVIVGDINIDIFKKY